jgi:hypothetical protein
MALETFFKFELVDGQKMTANDFLFLFVKIFKLLLKKDKKTFKKE